MIEDKRTYTERYTLQERHDHLAQSLKETVRTLNARTRALGRVLGPQECPVCGAIMLFFPEASIGDPVHLILYACPNKNGHLFEFSISDFTEEMVGKDAPWDWKKAFVYEEVEVSDVS